jgi:serine protease AprX
MLEANPTLAPEQIRNILVETAFFVQGAPRERQGAGVVQPALAVARALRAPGGPLANFPTSTLVSPKGIQFVLFDRDARDTRVLGSWNGWQSGEPLVSPRHNGIWLGGIEPLPPGEYAYKFLLDGTRWLDDPENPIKVPDKFGGWNSLLVVP